MVKQLSAKAQAILDEYRTLQAIRNPSRLQRLLESESRRSERYAQQWNRLARLLVRHQISAAELFFSGQLTVSEMKDLFQIGSDSGSEAKEDNLHWHSFAALLRHRLTELPPSFQGYLNWLLKVRGW